MIKRVEKIDGVLCIEAKYNDITYNCNIQESYLEIVDDNDKAIYELDESYIEDLRFDGFLISTLIKKLVPLEDIESLSDIVDFYVRGGNLKELEDKLNQKVKERV